LCSEKTIFKHFILEIAECQLPLDLLYDTGVMVLRCKHNVDVKLCKMPSIYKTLPFDREILLEFDISALNQLKN